MQRFGLIFLQSRPAMMTNVIACMAFSLVYLASPASATKSMSDKNCANFTGDLMRCVDSIKMDGLPNDYAMKMINSSQFQEKSAKCFNSSVEEPSRSMDVICTSPVANRGKEKTAVLHYADQVAECVAQLQHKVMPFRRSAVDDVAIGDTDAN
ncbi:uncharacterized protein LOC144100419 isoform X2 [Amblyomma americanum]